MAAWSLNWRGLEVFCCLRVVVFLLSTRLLQSSLQLRLDAIKRTIRSGDALLPRSRLDKQLQQPLQLTEVDWRRLWLKIIYAPAVLRSDLLDIASVEYHGHTWESTPTHKQILLVGGTRGDDSSHARTYLEIRGCSRGHVLGVRQCGGWAGSVHAAAPVPWAARSALGRILSA